jgi:NADPH:quinone reductase-like Zn-dependent oxidoreductase
MLGDASMKAALITRFGGPEVLSSATVPDPVPDQGEVLVRVAACGVNNVDLQIRRGARAKLALPHICGGEVAGTVVALGPGATTPAVGTKVAVVPFVACGHCEWCRRGRPTICSTRDAIGLLRPGGYAELVAVPAVNAIALPAGVDVESAAALSLAGLTAWHMLVGRARLQPGEDVLVLGAGSGVGSIAIQLARFCGARVIATASNGAKAERAKTLGADAVVDARRANWSAQVLEATGGRGVDVVVEHVGAATWNESVRALAAGGRLVTCGATTGSSATLDLMRLFSDELVLLGSRGGNGDELQQLLRVAARGGIEPVIAARFTLSQAADAHRLMERGDHFGKILLYPEREDG